MAEYNSFTYDEIKSSDFGVYIGGEKTFDAPSLRGQSIEIPGRNGNVFISSDSYENVELVYPSFNFEPDLETFRSKLAKLRNALSSRASYKRLTDTLHPDEFRMAVFRDGFEVKPIKYNTAAEFDIVFDCKPQRFLKSGEIPVEYTPGQTPSDEQTKTGSIVTFEAEEGTIISDIKADINPVQDLHGYDKPWAGGNGKNILPMTVANLKSLNTEGSWSGNTYTINGVTFTVKTDNGGNVIGITTNGTPTENSTFILYRESGADTITRFGSNTAYILNGNSAGGSSRTWYVRLYQESPWVVIATHAAQGESGVSFNTSAIGSDKTVYCVIGVDRGVNVSGKTFYPMIRLASKSDATYEPYSNNCPISGWSEVAISRAGKNLLKNIGSSYTQNGLTFTVNADGSVRVSGTATATTYKMINNNFVIPDGNYIVSGMERHGSHYIYLNARRADGGMDYAYGSTISRENFIADASVHPSYDVGIGVDNGTTLDVTFYPMIRRAGTDASYEPYNGNTYTIDLKGKRYGGTLDVTNGVLKVCPYYASYNGETLTGEWVSDRDEYSPNTSPTIGAQVVNMGGSLTTVQLTPTEVKTLLGTNNIWADSGDITVKYGTSPYIIVNPTDFPSKPLLEVTGVGSFWLGDTQITITGTSGQIIYIDCETGECYKVTGGIISPANGLVTLNRLDFPKLASGINNIQLGSGISKVKITPRWWRL